MKGIFENQSADGKLPVVLLLTLALFGMFAATLLSIVFITGLNVAEAGQSFYEIHAMNLMSSLLVFIAPAYGVAWLCSSRPARFLSIHELSTLRLYIITTIMVLVLTPFIDLTSFINSKMQLPEFMSSVEEWMRNAEDAAAAITEQMLSTKGIVPFVINVLVIGVVAAAGEELFFRGALLTALRRMIRNPHVAIWVVAVIFSAIHFQFYGFLPRMLLGSFLGYLLYWSGSIWLPVYAHFLNNAMAVICVYAGITDASPSEMTVLNSADILLNSLIAAAGLVVFFYCVRLIKKKDPLDI